MTFRAVEVYEILEPLLKDYRKLRYRHQSKNTFPVQTSQLIQLHLAGYFLTYIDEFVDQLLNEERVCDIILPRLPKRAVLEESGDLTPRQSLLLDAMEGKEEGTRSDRSRSNSRSNSRSSRSGTSDRSRSPAQAPGEDESRQGSRSPSISRSVSPVGSDGRFRSRSRSVSPDRW
jgi:pre-mRNA-splicing factor 38A